MSFPSRTAWCAITDIRLHMVAHLFVMSAVQTQHHQGWWHRYKNPWLGAWNQCECECLEGKIQEWICENLIEVDCRAPPISWDLAILKVAYFSILVQESGILHYEPTFPAARPHCFGTCPDSLVPPAQSERFCRAGDALELEVIYGGGSKQQQLAGLRKKPTILAATPGRFLEFLEDHLALGESEALIGLGFLGDIECHQLKEILDRAEFEGLNFGHVCVWRFPFKGGYLQIHFHKLSAINHPFRGSTMVTRKTLQCWPWPSCGRWCWMKRIGCWAKASKPRCDWSWRRRRRWGFFMFRPLVTALRS